MELKTNRLIWELWTSSGEAFLFTSAHGLFSFAVDYFDAWELGAPTISRQLRKPIRSYTSFMRYYLGSEEDTLISCARSAASENYFQVHVFKRPLYSVAYKVRTLEDLQS